MKDKPNRIYELVCELRERVENTTDEISNLIPNHLFSIYRKGSVLGSDWFYFASAEAWGYAKEIVSALKKQDQRYKYQIRVERKTP
ncbi:MAG: hypothetical protein WC433_01805 [Candidatus Omnitrophota bacterium]